jgi:hypothetical protein
MDFQPGSMYSVEDLPCEEAQNKSLGDACAPAVHLDNNRSNPSNVLADIPASKASISIASNCISNGLVPVTYHAVMLLSHDQCNRPLYPRRLEECG